MNVGSAGGMDLATMKSILAGASATTQLAQAATTVNTAPTDAVSLAVVGKAIDSANQTLDVWA